MKIFLKNIAPLFYAISAKTKTPLLLLLLLCIYYSTQAQTRQKSITISNHTTSIDSFSIIPESFKLKGLDTNLYSLDPAKAVITVDSGVAFPILVDVSYSVFPFNFSEPAQHKTTEIIYQDQRVYNPFKSKNPQNQADPFDLGEIEKRGSVSRGITVGNNQNLSVNSSLNLQLNGRLNERFSLLAAITDDNIPIQPEGNTQQLQDFDQVYIQVYDENLRLTAGDFQAVRTDGYFMQFNKKLQGGRIQSRVFPVKGDSTKVLNIDASGAVSRGKFARQTIQGVEGNQGPYRLTGADNEPFVVILSGTERIYVDGRLLMRGQENDYIINYNTAEVTFTAKQPITKDRRIVAEYQYSEQNYARSLVYGGADYQSEKWKLNLAIYSEQDAKNQSLQQELTTVQKDVLRSIGDDLNEAYASSIDTAAYSENRVLYRKVDTAIYNAQLDDTVFYTDVLVRSNNPKIQLYEASFIDVGFGNGYYVLDQQLAYGKVYKWTIDNTGGVIERNGNYMPIIRLVTPKRQQMASASASYQVSKNILVETELTVSSNDLNTFSIQDDSDNSGIGAKSRIKAKQPLGKEWALIGNVDYEFVSKNFNQIERFRSVEFDRDWNIRNLTLSSNQNIIGLETGFQKKQELTALYGFKSFSAGKDFQGLQNGISLESNFRHLKGSYEGSVIQQEGDVISSRYTQHNTNIKIPFWKLQLGYQDDFEENLRFNPGSDTLNQSAYRWWEWQTSISNSDSAENNYALTYAERTDWLMDTSLLRKATFARIYGYQTAINTITNSSIKFRVNYRTLDILNPEITSQKKENTLLSRVEYQGRYFKGALTTSTFYEIGSGLENRREYIYIETTPGQGTHIFIDYNGDGEKDLDEFELAVQADQIASANFVKVFVPTNDYIKVFTNQFSQSLALRPASLWRSKEGFLKVISRFSDQFSYAVDRKNLEMELIDQFNPFLFNIEDSLLQSTNSNLRNVFYFNQTNPIFGADFNYQNISSRNLLTNGFEERSLEKYATGFRWNFTQIFSLEARAEQGVKSSASDASLLSSRNYQVNYQQVEPKLTLQPGTKWRLSYSFNYKEQQNTIENPNPIIGGEQAVSRKHLMEFNLSSPEKGSLLANASLVSISYSGNASSAVGYEILDGLQPGLNATWGISYQRVLANNLQISVTYNGRQSPGINMIHTGGVEARAFF